MTKTKYDMYFLVKISHVWIDGPQVGVEVLNLDYSNPSDDLWIYYGDSDVKEDIERMVGDEPLTEDWPPGIYGLDLEEDTLLPVALNPTKD